MTNSAAGPTSSGPAACTYSPDGFEPCGKTPVVADIFRPDPLKGYVLIVSLCRFHATDGRLANASALGMTWEYRETLTLVEPA